MTTDIACHAVNKGNKVDFHVVQRLQIYAGKNLAFISP